MPLDFDTYLLHSGRPENPNLLEILDPSFLQGYLSPRFNRRLKSLRATSLHNNKHHSFVEQISNQFWENKQGCNRGIGCDADCPAKSQFSSSDWNLHRLKGPHSGILGPKRKTGNKRPKVTFADDLGIALVSLHYYEKVHLCGDEEITDHQSKSDSLSDHSNIDKNTSNHVNNFEPAFELSNMDQALVSRRLEVNYVSLENVVARDGKISGTIKVRNKSFEKEVSLRYTCDGWVTSCESKARFLSSCMDGSEDTFSFELQTSSETKQLQFAVRYRVDGQEHWDNNEGSNYIMHR